MSISSLALQQPSSHASPEIRAPTDPGRTSVHHSRAIHYNSSLGDGMNRPDRIPIREFSPKNEFLGDKIT
jgi:hypothetical protein